MSSASAIEHEYTEWVKQLLQRDLKALMQTWDAEEAAMERAGVVAYRMDEIAALPTDDFQQLVHRVASMVGKYGGDVRGTFHNVLKQLHRRDEANQRQMQARQRGVLSSRPSVDELEEQLLHNTVRWLDLFWGEYREDMELHGRRHFEGSNAQWTHSPKWWCEYIRLPGLFSPDELFYQSVPYNVRRRKPEYKFMLHVVNALLHPGPAIDHHHKQQQGGSDESLGWLRRPGALETALQELGDKLLQNSAAAEQMSRVRLSRQWLQRTAMPLVRATRATLTVDPQKAVAQLLKGAVDKDASHRRHVQDELRRMVEKAVADWDDRYHDLDQDEYVAYLRTEKESYERSIQSTRVQAEKEEVEYATWKTRWEHRFQQLAAEQLATARRQCTDIVEQLLQPAHVAMLGTHNEAVLLFQTKLAADPAVDEKSDDDDEDEDEDEDEAHRTDTYEQAYATMDLYTLYTAILTQAVEAVNEHHEALMSLSNQWSKAAHTALQNALHTYLDQDSSYAWLHHLKGFWQRRDEQRNNASLSHIEVDAAWTQQIESMSTQLDAVERSIELAKAEQRDHHAAYTAQMMQSPLEGAVGDVPSAWYHDVVTKHLSVDEDEALWSRVDNDIHKLGQQPRSKGVELLLRCTETQKRVLQAARQRKGRKRHREHSSTTVSFNDVVLLWLTMHTRALIPSLA